MVEYENLFLTKISFGMYTEKFIIIAKDMEEADKTINDYFDENYEVMYLLSVNKINDLIMKIQERPGENFHLIIELGTKESIDKNGLVQEEVFFNEHEEFGLEFDELHLKYAGKQIIVLSYPDIIDLVGQIHTEFENKDNNILVSKSFENLLN